MKVNNKNAPPTFEIPPRITKRQKIIVVITRNGRISMKIVMSTSKGDVIRTTPSTSVKLVRQDPMISPTARCVLRRLTATRAVENSGREVPIATSFAPTRIWGTPKAVAMFEAELTANWADITTTMKLDKSVEITHSFFLLLIVFPSPFETTGGAVFLLSNTFLSESLLGV